MELVRKQLTAAEVIPPNIRYNPDTDQVQFSPDGGVNWYDTPSADPRHSDVFRYPPLETMDARCDAAANMRKWLKDFLDQATFILCEGATALSVANAAIPLYELITGGSLTLLSILTEVAGGLFTIGCTALTAAFDDDVYDLIECIFYCQIGLDGQVMGFQLGAIETQVTAQLTTTAALIVNTILSFQGEVGLSNAGVIGGQTGDCSDCGCTWCFRFEDATGLGDWTSEVWSAGHPVATYSGGAWHSACFTDGHTVDFVHLRMVLPDTITMTDAAVLNLTNSCTGGGQGIYVNGDGSLFSGTQVWAAGGSYIGGMIAVDSIDILVFCIDSGCADINFDGLQFSGEGDVNPFGTNNC